MYSRAMCGVFPAVVLLVTLANSDAGSQRVVDETESKTCVLVHGGGSGGWRWKGFAPLLTQRGHVVYRPTLTGVGERVHLAHPDVDLDVYVEDIVKVLEYEELEEIILVGHSYGGMVITGVVDRVPERIKHVVYVDAVLPEDGESFATLFPEFMKPFAKQVSDGGSTWKFKYSTMPKVDAPPIKTFTQPITLSEDHPKVPGTYILTIAPGETEDSFTRFYDRAKSFGWPVHVLRTGHSPQDTMPTELAAILLDIE